MYADDGGSEVTLPITAADGAQCPLAVRAGLYRAGGGEGPRRRRHRRCGCVAGAIRVGDDVGMPLHHFPLEEAAAAHAAVEDSILGKVLIDMADPVR